jgi:H+/Cl- antiporter ClcA
VANDSDGANTVTELRDLLMTYAKQQTIEPLRDLGRYLAFGLAGSALVGIAAIFLSLGILRLLQDETGSTFTGHLSWIPYLLALAVVVAGLAVIALVLKRVKAAQSSRVPRSSQS